MSRAASVRSLLALLREAEGALAASQRQFEDYAQQHRAKDPPQYEKAHVNDAMAATCATVLAKLRGAL